MNIFLLLMLYENAETFEGLGKQLSAVRNYVREDIKKSLKPTKKLGFDRRGSVKKRVKRGLVQKFYEEKH